MAGEQRGPMWLDPGWLCDGPGCTEVVHDAPGRPTKESLERAGWLVEAAYGSVVRAWCPRCRRGRAPRPN